MKKKFYIFGFVLFFVFLNSAKGQFTSCVGSVPQVSVDLSARPDTFSTILLDFNTTPLGECCSLNPNYNCYEILLNLHPNSVGVNVSLGGAPGVFEVYTSPCGGGGLSVNQFDQIICLSGGSSHRLLFCTSTLTTLDSISITSYFINTGYTNTNVSCNGGNDGRIEILSASTPTTTYSYSWSNSASGNIVNNVFGGEYYVTITNTDGCSRIDSTEVFEPAPLSPNETVNMSCNSNSIGSISLNVTGGTAPYTYLWDNSSTNSSISGLSPGDYNVVITDNNSCSLSYGPINVAAYQDPNVIAQASSISLCFGDTVSLTGAGAITYLWDNGVLDGISFTPGLGNVTYYVTGTDANGCTGISSVEVTVHDNPTLATLTSNIDCFGNCNGSIDLSVSGPSAIADYLWSNGFNTEDISNVCAGTYTVTATDFNNCKAIITDVITSRQIISTSLLLSNPLCFGSLDGVIDLSVSNVSTSLDFIWSNGSTTEDLTGLGDGNYEVTITDITYNCSISTTTALTAPSALTITPFTTNVSCFGLSDGIIDNTTSGGIAPYNFLWSNGSTLEDLNNLPTGLFDLTVTDFFNCTEITNITITEPASLTVYTTLTDPSCSGNNNGSIDLTVIGGTFPYTYIWSNGETSEDLNSLLQGLYDFTVTDANLCNVVSGNLTLTEPNTFLLSGSVSDVTCNGFSNGIIDLSANGAINYLWNNGSTNEDLNGLSQGIYTVTVSDGNNCSASYSRTVNEPSLLSILNINFTNISCFGDVNGAIDITVTGGVPTYSYDWGGQTTEDISGLAAGVYAVTVTDANSCSVIRALNLSQPATLTATLTQTNSICISSDNGSIDITAGGGTVTGAYGYIWSNGETTEDVSNLAAGIYTVTITDDLNCLKIKNATITEPSQISINPIITNASCFGFNNGIIDNFTSGGTTPYNFQWSNGETTEDVSGLAAGQYNLTITDVNNCRNAFSIPLTEPTQLIISNIATTNSSCTGNPDGTVDVNAIGGISPYNFIWDNNLSGQTSNVISGIAAGTYGITVLDANGCYVVNNFSINRQNNLSGRIVIDDNNNCIADPNESGIVGSMIRIEELGSNTVYTNVYNSAGNYAVSLDTGTYLISILPPNPYWQSCTTPQTVVIDSTCSQNNLISCPSPVTGTTFLPDGNGLSYTTSLSVSCFNAGQTFTSVNDLQNVCLDIEHSYLSDLEIELICPNGQAVILKSLAQGGGSTYLGCPLDDPTVGPGTGRQYCFTPTATTSLVSGATSACGTPASASLNAGNYMPTESFAGFIGCPLNGNWTIRVTDSLSGDNGYIFGWDLNFAAQDWVLQPIITCPNLVVDMNVPILRKTSASNYVVSYCNTGNTDAANAMIQVKMDPDLNVLSTSIPIASQNGNIYDFNIGNVAVGQCGSFFIEVIVDLASFSGQTHCSYAHISPDSICVPNLWSGAILESKANCNNDTVFFRIENSGADMSSVRPYYIFEDEVMIAQDFFQINSGNFKTIAQPATLGKTYRIIVKQEAGFPELLGDSCTTVFVENCNAATGTAISRGYGLYFSNGNIAPAKAVDCVQNVSAFDPNDKKGQPVGYGANNYIYDYTTLEYTIRFQNLGTDTAFNVLILDTISSFFDLSSIVVGASSHNNVWQIIDGNVLRISFPNIKLPDSTTNELLSNGFIKYRIDQQSNNPVGTLIENRAAIYFDFEDAVITNTTAHIVNEDFEITLVSTETISKDNISVQIYPNPFDNETTIMVNGKDFNTLSLSIFDSSGRVVKEITGSGNQIQVNKEKLTQGIYFFKLSSEGEWIQSGKIIVK